MALKWRHGKDEIDRECWWLRAKDPDLDGAWISFPETRVHRIARYVGPDDYDWDIGSGEHGGEIASGNEPSLEAAQSKAVEALLVIANQIIKTIAAP